MTKNVNKRALISSLISLFLCVAMLLGTTYAWFTDQVSSARNLIVSGNLDVELFHADKGTRGQNERVDGSTVLFDDVDSNLWEPGAMAWERFTVQNAGSLALNYQLGLNVLSASVVDGVSFASMIKVAVVDADFVYSRENVLEIPANQWKSLESFEISADSLLSGESHVFGVIIWWKPSTIDDLFNMNNGKAVGSVELELGVFLRASQHAFESDSFDDSYDDGLVWPDISADDATVSTPITLNADGTLTENTTMSAEKVSALLPAGLKFQEGTTSTTLTVDAMSESGANITLKEDERTKSYDIHVDGIAADNTVPVEIFISGFLPVGLNAANFSLYHVENGETVTMTALADGATPVHNTFQYSPATGDVTLYLASFSEVALVAAPAKWKGDFDYSWYTSRSANDDVYYIANADQLAAFGAIVGGMNGNTRNTFAKKTVKLMADINIGDTDSENGIVFYPIGYYNSTGSYTKSSGGSVSSSVYSFKGTFDGNGYTVSNFYQNTWEMFGDYNDGYSGTPNHYKDGMGLFGYVNGGTVKNLTVNNFSSDGEFTPTGVIAAYACNATFENIAITNCNPGVYNTGNGGIVGIGGNSDDPDSYILTFSNITIDNTNKITALWGSWDVACGGLIGMFRGGGHVKMTNCHVGAQIDVYNDVCGNYQYYWYRYAGMLIGTNKNMITDANGYTMPETDKFEATGCTVHFGDWNNYYYCELVANSLASYTHDHQFSRLTEVDSVDVEKKTVTVDGQTTAIPTGGRYNYVVVNGAHATENATCYHFVDGQVWNHKDAGYEDVDVDGDGEKEHVLKEDRQHYYLPFNQLFTGYGWGVKHVPIYNDETQNPFKGVKILDRDDADSVVKFEGRYLNREVTADGTVIEEGILTSPVSGRHYKLSHLFNYLESCNVRVIPGAITVTVTNLDDNGNVTATLERDPNNWEDSVLTFSGGGRIRLTIQDYYYCTPTSIEIEVRNYPEGSKIRNFTYDGFANDHDYHFGAQADHITNGKHGIYEFDFGYGPEVLDYAHKLDSKGKIVFTVPADGKLTMAIASQNAGSGIQIAKKTGTDSNGDVFGTPQIEKIAEPYVLKVVQVDVKAGETYQITRYSKECGIYYIGYVPGNHANYEHVHAYYDETTATCTADGTTTEMCLICGKTNTYKTEKLGHTYETLDLCLVQNCGKSYDAHKSNALGHAYLNELGYHETCTDNGKKPGVYCTRCDHIQSGCETIQAHGHNYVNGFCRCGSHQCHQPEKIDGVYKEVRFTTGDAKDYADYGTNSFFQPHGSCDMGNDKKYLIMKTDSNSKNAYIEFTVEQAVTFYAKVSSTGRGNYSNFVLRKVDGENETNVNSIFHPDEATIHVEGVSGHTIVYTLEAGTYRFYCTSNDRVGRVMAMTVSTTVIDVN